MKNEANRQLQYFTIFAVGILLFCLMYYLFYTIIEVPEIKSDFRAHIKFARQALFDDAPWPRHFVYFALISSTSFWTDNLKIWNISAALWSAGFIVAKFYAVYWFVTMSKPDQSTTTPETENDKFHVIFPIIIAVSLLFIFPFSQPAAMENGFWYIYSFPPNIWHNSTQIALMPFAIIVFILSSRQLEENNGLNNTVLLAVFAALSAATKPSFIIAWIPAYALCVAIIFLNTRSVSNALRNTIPLLISLAILALQYVLIYQQNINGTSIEFGYLEAWLSYPPRHAIHFLMAILLSSLFPISYYLAFPKDIKNTTHYFTILMVAISYFYAFAVSEAGDLKSGNFMWPIITTNFLLYMLCARDLFQRPGIPKIKLSMANISLLIFSLNVLFGFGYIAKYTITREYY